ncbi:MAG: hypothetical protein BWX80_02079 [Candidatus Hydrogenedentes bacterium ADurb.Bin101]|nr:MAG: hypothetical protein BWX80_02079 [Candidatus Hydrogenedentes bacterium ADurb.Bin101]
MRRQGLVGLNQLAYLKRRGFSSRFGQLGQIPQNGPFRIHAGVWTTLPQCAGRLGIAARLEQGAAFRPAGLAKKETHMFIPGMVGIKRPPVFQGGSIGIL